MGADRGGFYSYQWLENIVGCKVSNAETIHPEWEVTAGAEFSLGSQMPPLRVADAKRGEYFVVHRPPDPDSRPNGKPWVMQAGCSW